jgi:2-polyprenyl-3-methyl-5-hydroxy-6-metoxy-1,4-benzoquinol methylase
MKISGGLQEDGVAVGNVYDKYGSRNPFVQWIMRGFSTTLARFVEKAKPETIHEIGCGEGYWVLHWNRQGIKARGSDFSEKVISLARDNAKDEGVSPIIFKQSNIYEIKSGRDSADLIVCCEVLEHLERPEAALASLEKVATDYVILSVPREPIWRTLNMLRGKYLASIGNTPGHIQHWSTRKFTDLVGRYFDIVEVQTPLPWTMLLCRQK